MRIVRGQEFEEQAQELLGEERFSAIVNGLEWTLQRSAEMGVKVRGYNDLRVWPVYPGDGFVYAFYYRITDDNTVRLLGAKKRPTPVSPQLFDLEDD